MEIDIEQKLKHKNKAPYTTIVDPCYGGVEMKITFVFSLVLDG